jgi:hypothetical protein
MKCTDGFTPAAVSQVGTEVSYHRRAARQEMEWLIACRIEIHMSTCGAGSQLLSDLLRLRLTHTAARSRCYSFLFCSTYSMFEIYLVPDGGGGIRVMFWLLLLGYVYRAMFLMITATAQRSVARALSVASICMDE